MEAGVCDMCLPVSYQAVICAAGAGTRMGCNKALCRLSDCETFLSSIVVALVCAGVTQIVVVTGAQSDDVRSAHARLDVRWVVNERWASTHMLESLSCGIRCLDEHCGVIHWPVDCVGVHMSDLCRLLHARPSPFAALAFGGKRAHPLRISPHMADILRSGCHSFDSLRAFSDSQACTLVEAEHPALPNCNNPEMLADFLAIQRQM